MTMLVVYVNTKIDHKKSIRINSFFPTFYDWKKACDSLAHYNGYTPVVSKTILNEKALLQEIDCFCETMRLQIENINWIESLKPLLFPTDNFQAYVEKLLVPENAIIAIHGELKE